MPNIVGIGEAIEGDKVDGSARNELQFRGIKRCNLGKCFRWVATFDIRAGISAVVRDPAMLIEPNALLISGNEIVCVKAIISSLDKNPGLKIAPRSGKHKAQFWHYSKQTAVRIDISSLPH